MNLLREYIRGLLAEASEYDDQFERLMATGYEGILQAMQLADTLDIPTQELPWELNSVEDYVRGVQGPEGRWGDWLDERNERIFEPTGWTLDDYYDALAKRRDRLIDSGKLVDA